MTEHVVKVWSGWTAVAWALVVLVFMVGFAGAAATADSDAAIAIFGVLAALSLIKVAAIGVGFFLVKPNHAKVLVQFGRYAGTVRDEGFHWTWPWRIRRTFSLRIKTFDSDTLKVNDAVGNPIEIASVINWQVADTAKAAFDVEDYESFVFIQTETAVRHVASQYPYDDYEQGQVSLRANADEVTATLQNELQERLSVAGVTVLDTRLRRLAYAPEIAGEMLRRQQASAVVAARQLIVEGAVGMVDHALQLLSEQQIVELDEERKASMVSNLMVVLCSDRGAQPIVNAGSLYQ
ncbi:MAG TPA: SPFH domain-containing protein [Acidimicrobiales bacterium]|nr:SPFH domain-containing protein [Acidimicrobiales bacterium]